MVRLFLQAYLRLLAAVALGAILFATFVGPLLNARLRQNIEEDFSAPLSFFAETLADEHRRSGAVAEATLARAARRFKVPVALVPRSAVHLADEGARSRLDRGEVVAEWAARVTGTYLVRVEGTELVLVIGPVHLRHPLDRGRGVVALVMLLGALLLGMYLVLLPIQRRLAGLAKAADDFGRGHLETRAEPGPLDAIGGLVRCFNRMAEELQRLIGAHKELLHTVSHELRTPLQRLHFAGELVRSSPDAGERERGLDRIERDIEELERLIEELLTYARLGEAPEAAPPVDLRPVLREVVEMFAEERCQATLATRGTAEEALGVRVEPHLLRRAISNLLVNAMRHARSRVEIEAARQGEWIRIDVDDDGPGVPEPDQPRIFEPFYRVDDAVTRRSRGFGLGLPIARSIVERHGGRIEVQTSDLGGARFRASFPLASFE